MQDLEMYVGLGGVTVCEDWEVYVGLGIVGLVEDLGYIGSCFCSSDTECRWESETGITFPYLNANESEGGIMNYPQSCMIHYPVR